MTTVPMAVATVLVTAATAVWLLRHLAAGDLRCSWVLCCGLGSSALVDPGSRRSGAAPDPVGGPPGHDGRWVCLSPTDDRP
ncbi:hypothetical protein ACFVAF_22375 [Streptomyces sp. NPDC057596]|uniref:hypothetical protein n=1 Tax=Streptomyces sp. NPDC057596 TaxID=3346178 RepID=UPI003675B419